MLRITLLYLGLLFTNTTSLLSRLPSILCFGPSLVSKVEGQLAVHTRDIYHNALTLYASFALLFSTGRPNVFVTHRPYALVLSYQVYSTLRKDVC